MLPRADADVQVNPACIDITVQPIEERVTGEPARLTHERVGGGPGPDGETHGRVSFGRNEDGNAGVAVPHFSRGCAGGQEPITESEARFLRPGSKFAIVPTTWILIRRGRYRMGLLDSLKRAFAGPSSMPASGAPVTTASKPEPEEIRVPEVTAAELIAERRNGAAPLLLDCRENYERRQGYIPGSTHIVMREIPYRLGELDRERRHRRGLRARQPLVRRRRLPDRERVPGAQSQRRDRRLAGAGWGDQPWLSQRDRSPASW